MKYSEVKQRIKWLHVAGWEKIKGLSMYKKDWNYGELRYRQTIYFDEVRYTNLPIGHILHEYDLKAEREFKRYEDEKLKNGPFRIK